MERQRLIDELEKELELLKIEYEAACQKKKSRYLIAHEYRAINIFFV